jgi:hypothetical protein
MAGIVFSVVIFLSNESNAQGNTERLSAASYKRNNRLSGLLEKEGIKFNISKDEAAKIYGPYYQPQKTYDVLKVNDFYWFYNDKLNTLITAAKLINKTKDKVDIKELRCEFDKQYGTTNGHFFLLHHGSCLEFNLNKVFDQKSSFNLVFYDVIDHSLLVK